MPLFFILIFTVILICFLASRRPDQFSLTRTLVMNAKPDTIFPHVNRLKSWEAWSPWAKLDPEAVSIYSGPEEGVGANMSWKGNMKVGSGAMTITESTLPSRIMFRLDFEKPMKATNEAIFTFTPQTEGTLVAWSMSGQASFMAKLMGLLMNCDAMVARQFDQGLASLKAVVETSA